MYVACGLCVMHELQGGFCQLVCVSITFMFPIDTCHVFSLVGELESEKNPGLLHRMETMDV